MNSKIPIMKLSAKKPCKTNTYNQNPPFWFPIFYGSYN